MTDNDWGNVRRAVTIDRTPEDLYTYWRKLDTLPHILSYIKSVTVLDDKRSHWIAKGPLDVDVEWDAEITEDIPNKKIAWRSLLDADVQNQGAVEFIEAANGEGTEVHVDLTFKPPGGVVGKVVASIFHRDPDTEIAEDLQRFKQAMEAGVASSMLV